MIRKVLRTLEGKPVYRLIPETEEDIKELDRLAEQGLLERTDRFMENPTRDVWEREEKKQADEKWAQAEEMERKRESQS